MSAFAETYSQFVEAANKSAVSFGYDVDAIGRIEPFLAFLYNTWWRVDLTGLQFLPADGPALIIGNAGSGLPWPAMMLMYALMSNKQAPRKLNILADMDWIEDERIYTLMTSIGFVPWSADNAKRLFADGQLVVTFPEGVSGLVKPFSERYRLREFDWTRLLPAVEERVPVYPLASLGCDEVQPVFANVDCLAKALDLPEFPITPFFPWLPFPASLLVTFPVRWQMRILKATHFGKKQTHDDAVNTAMAQARYLEGEIQGQLNRLLRGRLRKSN